MLRPKILAMILAGGPGGRLGALTDRRSKPSLPVGGHYRMIDIPLSNLAHSKIADVWVVEQYLPFSLNDHVANGRPWDLDRTDGGLRILPPYQGAAGEGFAEGNADALHRQAGLVRDFNPDLVLVLSADHLYRLDYRDVVDTHYEAGADLTMVTTKVGGDVSRYSVVEVEGGRVTGFEYKPEQPKTDLVAAEVFLYNADVLLETMDRLAAENGEGLKDYGDVLVPHLVEHATVAEHRHDGYWRDLGTIPSFWEAHMQLLDGTGFNLQEQGWPVRTASPQLMPAFVASAARIEGSLVSAGSTVHGTVVRSVVGPGAVVEEGAVVRDSVLLHGVRVEAGAELVRTVADDRAMVGRNAKVGGDGDITVLGQDSKVAAGTSVAAGEQLEPDSGR
ncbi:glucose-1-phosphate adenylyltransferase family protein [Arthrobacter mobilis]|uniref:NTP transferase domain-containing protein n=1 Tax=Arthrobacter mobilis TaxID=2724944 RepID=A0A7X6HG22_9MICC|nr:sugar phosphate nucleotidyltransferase [Arthrobacter mobilis]NKX55725.1 NTP transferase domain-containing protein [Arthrobacter mobilis]